MMAEFSLAASLAVQHSLRTQNIRLGHGNMCMNGRLITRWYYFRHISYFDLVHIFGYHLRKPAR